MRTNELTIQQRMILEAIRDSIQQRGYPPSVREVGAMVGMVSPSSVQHQIQALERKGYLRRYPHRARALEVTEKGGAPLRPHVVDSETRAALVLLGWTPPKGRP